jgi:hypothetical protein
MHFAINEFTDSDRRAARSRPLVQNLPCLALDPTPGDPTKRQKDRQQESPTDSIKGHFSKRHLMRKELLSAARNTFIHRSTRLR